MRTTQRELVNFGMMIIATKPKVHDGAGSGGISWEDPERTEEGCGLSAMHPL
jgi:hypothetical protein